ncbi:MULTISPECIES: hypothetical protein [Burkholderia]|uniref:hypothetical protein n=1 Tax=Burkholderia TaxID=32008 RepID=UPI002585108C|nr:MULTISPECIES: hypothetical protein [Burkholderia]MCL4632822.1 hypothetical protein [Burkholderia sp.]MDN7454415.1 hypothetical protein [Burkholderia cenocepacia]
MTIEDLSKALRAIAEENWRARSQPVLLSVLPKMLSERLREDYKPVLGSRSLKNFIKGSSTAEGYRLVEHPSQRAKLGIVPASVDFEFSDEASIAEALADVSKQDVDGFVKVLASLTPDELRRVSLPASLVVRLMSTK